MPQNLSGPNTGVPSPPGSHREGDPSGQLLELHLCICRGSDCDDALSGVGFAVAGTSIERSYPSAVSELLGCGSGSGFESRLWFGGVPRRIVRAEAMASRHVSGVAASRRVMA